MLRIGFNVIGQNDTYLSKNNFILCKNKFNPILNNIKILTLKSLIYQVLNYCFGVVLLTTTNLHQIAT